VQENRIISHLASQSVTHLAKSDMTKSSDSIEKEHRAVEYI